MSVVVSLLVAAISGALFGAAGGYLAGRSVVRHAGRRVAVSLTAGHDAFYAYLHARVRRDLEASLAATARQRSGSTGQGSSRS